MILPKWHFPSSQVRLQHSFALFLLRSSQQSQNKPAVGFGWFWMKDHLLQQILCLLFIRRSSEPVGVVSLEPTTWKDTMSLFDWQHDGRTIEFWVRVLVNQIILGPPMMTKRWNPVGKCNHEIMYKAAQWSKPMPTSPPSRSLSLSKAPDTFFILDTQKLWFSFNPSILEKQTKRTRRLFPRVGAGTDWWCQFATSVSFPSTPRMLGGTIRVDLWGTLRWFHLPFLSGEVD